MESNHVVGWLRKFGVSFVILACALAVVVPSTADAQEFPNQEFNIQVTPAILPVVLRPGTQQIASISVRNLSNHSETLTPRLSGFKTDKQGGKIKLDYIPPANMAEWVTFRQASITLKAGESKSIDIAYDTPSNVGFSYTTAITLSRSTDDPTARTSNTSLRGTVAVFNLVNIDRPGAKRELKIENVSPGKGTYEFLPATINLTIANAGNVIDQPSGNIFIQRSFDDAEPITTIPINAEGTYILPGNSRQLSVDWKDGFPVHTTKNGERSLVWNWKEANSLRFGKYVAKVVLVYNDGQRDVPTISSVTFWVIPWRIIIVSLILITVLVMGLFGWGKVIALGTKKVRRYAVRK